ncbi:MAG: HAD-IC family P-type ATPase, partial [Desulfobacterales bacterium]|nr:HAD-IC family P-type ATPase [Desulfobacterales bacterium]
HPIMETVHQWDAERELNAFKGAPLEVLEQCSHLLRGGATLPLTEADRDRIEADNFRMAGGGLRVLGLAFRWGREWTEAGRYTDGDGLVWSGLVGLSDPVRRGAREVVQALHRSGIRTAVLTGDQSLTARHIGNRLGLSGGEPLRILDAAELRDGALTGLAGVVARTHVFTRLTPTQKLQIIQSYQSAGLSVVMVGDGFNDVLALKVADVGIAMGLKGADMARKAADLVLEDDALENVPAAIEGGRRFYGNMRRSLRFLSGAAHVDIAAALAAKAACGGAGLSPLQPVFTNLAALSLAVDASGRPDGAAPQGPEPAWIDREQLGGALADAARVVAVSGLAGGYAVARYGGGAAAGRVFWSSLALNQLLLALEEEAPAASAERPRPVLWGIAGLPLLLFALTGGGLVDLLVIAGGGWLARRWSGQHRCEPDAHPSKERA